MPFRKWIRWNINLWFAVVTAVATIFAGVEMLLAAGPETKAPSPGMATATPASLSPIPVPDSLAQPRSLKQFGVPLLQTLAEIPTDNPQTPERIALGEKLFFEPRLSVDRTVACASCHNPDRAFTDGKPTSVGFKGSGGPAQCPYHLECSIQQETILGRAGRDA